MDTVIEKVLSKIGQLDAAVEAKGLAEQASVDAAAATYGDVGLVVSNGKLCVRVERE